MVAKCGERKAWHWAHKGPRDCDSWWENETEWHRNWKDQFPENWQEIVQYAEDGERHIADVKTDDGWVIEIQHSKIAPDERRSREDFYPKLVWVVDATTQGDKAQFLKAWEEGTPVGANSTVRRASPDKSVLLREWAESPAPVFFDFGEEEQNLGWLLDKRPGGPVYVAPFPRAMFIGIHRGMEKQAARDFDSFVAEISELVANYESHLRVQALPRLPPHPVRRRVRRRGPRP
jgi:competence protein CoiA